MGYRPDAAFAIRSALPKSTRTLLLVVMPAAVLLVWIGLSASGAVPPDFLPSPLEVVRGLLELFFTKDLGTAILWSSARIGIAVGLSMAIALPLGILMGAFSPVEALLDPIMAPLRYMPITAFIPLLILWFGIFEKEKIVFLFLGTFVYLLPVVVNAIKAVPEELVQTAYTLGASPWTVIRTVLIPQALPDIFDSFRVMNAIAWTYVILAEVVNPGVGLGYIVELARTHNKPSWCFAGLIVIGGIGLLTDLVIRLLGSVLFRWREAT